MKTKRINKFLLAALLILTFVMTAAIVACGNNDGDKKWKVTFNYNYTGAPSAAFTEVEVKNGEKVAEPTTEPEREGYDFKGWFTDAACAESTAFGFATTEIKADTTLYAGWKEEVAVGAANVSIDYASEVTAYDGTWTVTKVYTGGETKETKDAVADAITLEVVGEYIFKNVNEADYIGNMVYNFTSNMTFGIPAINAALSAKGIDCYSGVANWSTFTMGEVMEPGEDYVQPGPGIMDFGYANNNFINTNNAMRDNGLFLDLVAGVSADVDTENRALVFAMNEDGQLLLGYSMHSIEYPDVDGDWEYCLVFDKAE